MQYGRMPLPDRRDSNLDSNGSTPFQSHQSLGQALGTHIAGLQQNGAPSQPHQAQSHSPLFSVAPAPAMKRKPDVILGAAQQYKRGRHADTDGGDTFDIDGNAQGAKHWTDEEKTRLFTWLMGQGQDEHWSSLRATKNSCLRECAVEVFGSKKTYQALKGCYERNFNLFKQIYTFEGFQAQTHSSISGLSEPDRLREYERRLQNARKSGCDIGNINARTIDHWHRIGWYDLFYRRWHGDLSITKPLQQPRNSAAPANAGGSGGGDDGDDDDPQLDFPDPMAMDNVLGSALGQGHDRNHPITFINQQTPREPAPTISIASPVMATGLATNMGRDGVGVVGTGGAGPLQSPTNSDQALVNLSITQGMMSTYLQFLQVQTQTGKMKLEYLRRREEREERESAQRRDMERLKMEREIAEFEHNKQKANMQQKADRALDLITNPSVDASVKQVASDYLKKLFAAAD